MIANSFDFWLSFSLGGAIVVALVGFATAFIALRNAVKKRGTEKRSGAKP